MEKRTVLCFVLVLVCATAGLFAGGQQDAAGAAKGEITLTVWDFKFNEGPSHDAMVQIDKLFEQRNPGVKINHVAQPGEPQYYQVIQAAAGAGQGPDVAMFHPGARSYGFDDILVDLTQYVQDVKDQFTPASLAMVSTNGKLGAPIKLLPMTMQGFGIWYNKDYFRKAGLDPENPPKTADAFVAACEKLRAAGIVPVTVGQTFTIDFAIRCIVANIYGPNVAGLRDGSQKFAGNAQFKEAVTALKMLVDKGYFEKEGFSRPYFTDAIDTFAAGRGAMFVGLLSDIGNWKQFSDKLGVNNVGYFPTINFPSFKYQDQQVAQGAGIGYGVMTWSKNQKLAAEYVKTYATGEGAKIYATSSGALSPNMAVSGLEASYPALKVVQGYLKNFADDYIPLFYNGFEDDSNRLCDRYFITNEISADQFIAEYQKLIDKK
jgi:raffinose/stachyose/melibiose transport system substrate-binding protein